MLKAHISATILAATILGTIVIPSVSTASTYPTKKDSIVYNGQTLYQPYGVVANGTTYMPIWYVQQALKSSGIAYSWDGSTWNIQSSYTVDSLNRNLPSGSITISLNSIPFECVNGFTSVDPASQTTTTYLPIWYIQQALNRVGIASNWNGQNWALTSHVSWRNYITEGTMDVSDGSGSQTVTYIRINTKNPHISVQPVVAGNHFGSTASLAALAQSDRAIAAMNGTFFNAYSDKTPQGTIMIDGRFEHLWGPTILGIADDGSLSMVRAQESVTIGIDGQWTWPNVLNAWGINTWGGQVGEISVLTPYYGTQANIPTATSVVVKNGVVTDIQTGNTQIPKDGFVVELADANLASKIKVGEKMTYQVTLTSLIGNRPIAFSNMKSAIGSGPMLVDEGNIVLDPKLEGLNNSSLIDSVTIRSFAGIDSNGDLILATVRNANMGQLAQIAYHMHLQEAMNLDGGSSSGLYFNGLYLLTPGRVLADALTVTYQ